MDKITAQHLTQRAAFYEPVEERDADGMLVQSWLLRITCAAHVTWLRGGETVMAARMQSKNPAIITVRDFTESRAITSEWRAEIAGKTYEIREDPRPSQDRRLLEMLAEG